MNRATWLICWILFLLLAHSAGGAEPEPSIPSFRHEIVPLLTRYGCNAGACHGKLAGQNGFRLSLRGFAIEDDYTAITRDVHGRRLDRLQPERSLLVAKPAGMVPHGGKRLLPVGSRGYERLLSWIAAGAPGPLDNEPAVERIVVQPGSQTVSLNQQVQLQVTAQFNDGTAQDVTWLANFYSSDQNVASVTVDGQVRCVGPGEATVRIQFEQHVEVVTLTLPYSFSVDPQLYSQRLNAIDECVLNKLSELHLPPAALCDDATFLRRAYLDTIGTLPTTEEARRFLNDSSFDKRARLVEELLSRPEWVDYWALQLAELLQNRRGRDSDYRGAKGVRALHYWLRQQLSAGRGWRDIARDVLLATGDTGEHPEVGYYVVTIDTQQNADESDVVAGVAQSFLGTRIGCARCHNHPLERYTQDDYYHFAAFFSRVVLDRKSAGEGTTKVLFADGHEFNLMRSIEDIDRQLAALNQSAASGAAGTSAEQASKKDELTARRAQVEQELANARQRKVEVRQPRTGKMLPPQALDRIPIALAAGADPRVALTDWVTSPQNENFSGNMVNRIWRHFFAVGLVEPVDDLRPSNPPTNRQLWDTLNREFVASNYDFKHLMRLILNSRTYQASSATVPQNAGDQRYYSHYYARRLPAEVLLDAICSATGVAEEFPGYPRGMRAVQVADPGAASYFLTLFGRSPRVTACACERSSDVALPQLLHMLNGDWISAKLRAPESWLTSHSPTGSAPQQFVEELMLRTLCRLPTAAETELLTAALEQATNRDDAAADILWALLNTKEFTFNH